MFTSPKCLKRAIENRAQLLTAEQNCVKCRQWFDIKEPTDRELAAHVARREPGALGLQFIWVTCSHCTEEQTLIPPGKYDRLTSKHPELQRYSFAAAPRRNRAASSASPRAAGKKNAHGA